ncbi:hypothetical protein D5H75_39815 [Bailinhaonella thermotolerans]|uniref:Uncharacterized protein n=1 Tax=Bailinhaonella thermotolerans TaxID=1070861 RepID=A0A3A4A0H5_9ACTN|nr:hypothetical protein D5H75_39815 [Bailinhaonella thermotolerans]
MAARERVGCRDCHTQALLRAEYGELLAHARAAVAAQRAGESDPLIYLTGLLEQRGQLPPADATPMALVAQACPHTQKVDALSGGGAR